MPFKLKNTISQIRANKKTPYLLVFFVLVLHFLCLEAVWIYIDSFVFLKVNFNFLVPQHAPFYPGLIHLLKIVIKSDLALFWILKIIQNLVLLFSLFYLLQNVRRKLVTAFLICAMFPVFIVQNGLFSESFNISSCIFFLTTCYKLYTLRTLSRLDLLIHLCALLGLILTRHVGLLFILLPLLILFNYKNFQLKLKIQLVFIQLAAIFILFLANEVIRSRFEIIQSSMYGRPAMHIIEESVNKHRSSTLEFQKKWFKNAKNQEELKTQQIILADSNIWLGPRTKVFDYLKEKHPEWTTKQIDVRTENLLNQAYINFATTGDWIVWKQYLKTSVRLAIAPYTGYSIIKNDYDTKHENISKSYGLESLQHLKPEYGFSVRSAWILLFIIADIALSIFVLYTVISNVIRKKLDGFEKKILLFYLLQIGVHAVFTVYVSRYAVMLNLLLFFVCISILDKKEKLSKEKVFLS